MASSASGDNKEASAARTCIAILQGLVLFRDFKEDFFQGGIHQAKASQVQIIQAVLQMLGEKDREAQE